MAIETVLFGQALAAAEQLPGQRSEGVVEGHLGVQFGARQAQGVAAGVEQAVAALGLADVAGHQRQFCRQLGGQFQQGFGGAFAQLQLQLADFFLLLAGDHGAEVQCGFDHHLGLAAAPGDFGVFTSEIGGEQRLDGLFVDISQLLWPALGVEFFQVELGLGQLPLELVALGQAGDALAAGLEGLDHHIAVAAQAQGDLGGGQVALRGVEVLVEQFAALPPGLVALVQQWVFTQGGEGLAADPQFDFGFFMHCWVIQARMTGSVLGVQCTGVG
ncbi:hypothetical protein D3C78_882040 [compost metagenome]